MPPSQANGKKQPLTLTQISSYDDILTDALVDHVYYWTTIPKNRPSYHASRGVTEEEITKIIQSYLIVDTDIEVAQTKLLETAGLRKFMSGLKTPKEKEDFRLHLRRYMQIYLPDCPFEVSSTNRYTIVTQEAAVTARQFIRKGQPVKYLAGTTVAITPKEEKELSHRKKDFSIVVSSRSKCTNIFMGPARFANHDCGANARLMVTSQTTIEIIATRNIEVGDEITVTYGDNYFGESNCECLCRTCEENLANGWAQSDETGLIKKSIENLPMEGYAFRHRRRDDSCASDSRTSSLGPEIRPRIRKTRSKLSSTYPDTMSFAGSPSEEIQGQKRKRGGDSLKTPPITPSKRQRPVQYGVESLAMPSTMSRQTSENGSISATSAFSTSDSEATLTDATTPEVEELSIMASKTNVATTVANFTATTPELESMSISNLLNPVSETSSNSASITEALSSSHNVSIVENPATPPASQSQDVPPTPATVVSPSAEPTHGQGSKQSRKRGDLDVTETTDMPLKTNQRVPGDYTLTPILLSEPNTAWIHCMNCSEAFVQYNAYYTRSSCPRCERHSKLYGYMWPKTEPEGSHDKEERVLDHRTVHRFLDRQGEARVRGRQIPALSISASFATDDEEQASKSRGRSRKASTTAAEIMFSRNNEKRRPSSITPLRRSRSGRIICAPRLSDAF